MVCNWWKKFKFSLKKLEENYLKNFGGLWRNLPFPICAYAHGKNIYPVFINNRLYDFVSYRTSREHVRTVWALVSARIKGTELLCSFNPKRVCAFASLYVRLFVSLKLLMYVQYWMSYYISKDSSRKRECRRLDILLLKRFFGKNVTDKKHTTTARLQNKPLTALVPNTKKKLMYTSSPIG